MVLESTRKGNSIFDELKERAFALYMTERQSAYEVYTADDELNEALEMSEDAYNFNLLKLDDLAYLTSAPEMIQRRFIQQKLYIEQMDMSEKSKIETILTSASIMKNFGVAFISRSISEENFNLLAHAMVDIEPSNYFLYKELVLHRVDKLIYLLRKVNDSPIIHHKQYQKKGL